MSFYIKALASMDLVSIGSPQNQSPADMRITATMISFISVYSDGHYILLHTFGSLYISFNYFNMNTPYLHRKTFKFLTMDILDLGYVDNNFLHCSFSFVNVSSVGDFALNSKV